MEITPALVRDVMLQNEFRLEDLSNLSGISIGHLCDFKNGKVALGERALYRLEKALESLRVPDQSAVDCEGMAGAGQ